MNRQRKIRVLVSITALAATMTVQSAESPNRQMEFLDRGVVAMNEGGQVYVSWRLLASDPAEVTFDVYRRVGDETPEKLNEDPITKTTDFVDSAPGLRLEGTRYYVVPVVDGQRGKPEWAAVTGSKDAPYLSIKLESPGRGYSANDCSTADLDGDGRYELILKWDPRNAKDNSQGGITGNVYLDAYKLDGTRLWRIDLGPNIRAGAHYTQMMVYDFDGDGKAELICKTADGTVDGQGKVIGDDDKEWRNGAGHVLAGPEFLTCFDGETGEAVSTVDYVPYRIPGSSDDEPTPDEYKQIWGDNSGNRGERYLACVAYLDGEHPSVVMCRGYYTRTFLVAWDLEKGKLKKRWVFDSDEENGRYAGQGNHNLAVGDVDGDGKDEILYGAMCVDDDGDGLYTTRMGHGDAGHFTDLDPQRPGLEYWTCQEERPYGAALRDAGTGEIIFRREASKDTGRACAADIDPRYPGYELWASGGVPLFSAQGEVISEQHRLPINFVVNWDGDDLTELLDGTKISKYNWETGQLEILLDAADYDCASNNGTKATPCLSADLFGDYREEVVWRTRDSSELRIFTTTIPAKRRLITLMHDPIYRLSIAWQNVAYNQPPHPSFFLGDGMETPPKPNVELVQAQP